MRCQCKTEDFSSTTNFMDSPLIQDNFWYSWPNEGGIRSGRRAVYVVLERALLCVFTIWYLNQDSVWISEIQWFDSTYRTCSQDWAFQHIGRKESIPELLHSIVTLTLGRKLPTVHWALIISCGVCLNPCFSRYRFAVATLDLWKYLTAKLVPDMASTA